MFSWSIITLVSAALLPSFVGLVHGAVRDPMDNRGAVVVALVGGASVFWIAAGVLTVRVLF
jgi:hypothetical protein